VTIGKSRIDAVRVTGQSIDAGDDGRGNTGSTKDFKPGLIKRIVDRDAGVGIGYS
jgi:hypothetical protein